MKWDAISAIEIRIKLHHLRRPFQDYTPNMDLYKGRMKAQRGSREAVEMSLPKGAGYNLEPR